MNTLDYQTPPRFDRPPALEQAGLVQRFLLAAPLLLAAGFTISVCLHSIATRMGTRYPLDWWESIYIMDGARVANGLPVYEPAGVGHATHMYGPMGTYVIGIVYAVMGEPSVRVGRWLSLLSGFTATALFTLLFVSKRSVISLICFALGVGAFLLPYIYLQRVGYFSAASVPWSVYLIAGGLFAVAVLVSYPAMHLMIGAALLLSLHYRCMGLFTNTRPDITAYLLAGVGLLLAYFAHEKNRFGLYYITAALVVLAFLFKQTYAVAALVPPIAIVMIRPQPLRKHLLFSLLPLAAMAVTGIILKLFFPLVWFYAIDVPRLYRVFQDRVFLGIDAIFMHNPLFLLMAAMLLFVVGYTARRDRAITWLFSAMLVGGAMGVIAFAKRGGSYNSLLMIFGPMTAFCVMMFPRAIDTLHQPAIRPFPRLACSVVLGWLIFTTAFSVPLSKRLAFEHASNRRGYTRAIALVKTLDGKVVCPEEPTITLFAKGIYEPSLEAELEAAEPKRILVEWVTEYVASADWVITVGTADMPGRVAGLLPDLGFVKADHPELGSEYGIWRRAGPAPTTTQR